MRPDESDGPARVQFLVVTDVTDAPDAAGDPEAAGTGADRRRPRSVRAVAGAAVLLLVGVLAVRTATTRGTDHLPAAQPADPESSSSPSPSPAAITYRILDAGTGVNAHRTITLPSGLTACPPEGCTIAPQLPPPFVAAVAQRLRSGTPSQQVDVTVGGDGQAWYRQLTAAGPGHTSISVTVSKQDGGRTTTSGTTQTADSVVGTVAHPTGAGGFLVEVKVTGPVGWEPPLDAMQALAADPRIVAAG